MLIYLLNNNCTWCKAGLNSEVSQAKNWKTTVMNWGSISVQFGKAQFLLGKIKLA